MLFQTKLRDYLQVLSEPGATSDKVTGLPPSFVRTSSYFRQSCGITSKFCPNLELLRTKLRDHLQVLSELDPTSDKVTDLTRSFVRTWSYFRQSYGITSKFCPNLELLQTKLRDHLQVLSELDVTSDKVTGFTRSFVRTWGSYFGQSQLIHSKFYPNHSDK